ncbi:MAG: hypothetical protein R6U67_12735 [Sodalinema sp.]|uniref:hypothetical protein n=1 Tax=Sodalinema sp. TaxID=3080550 RepID=UPI00396F6AE1
MRQHRFTALGLALALVLGACGPDEQDFSAPDPDETPVAEQAPTDAPADAPDNGEEEIPEAEPFESPLVEEDEETAAAPSGLISSTNPQERGRQAQRNLDAGREDGADPFGILPVEVSRSQRQAENVPPQVPEESEPGATDTANGGRTGNGEGTDGDGRGLSPERTREDAETPDGIAAGPPLPPLTGQTMESLPDINPGDFQIPALRPSRSVRAEDLDTDEIPMAEEPGEDSESSEPMPEPTPPPPEIDLAQGTEVTGVIEVGGDVQVILQTPGSAFSRYVRVGDTIANGEVRVVRVERLGGEPLVILEQNGVEVARGIGEPAIEGEDETMTNWVGSR